MKKLDFPQRSLVICLTALFLLASSALGQRGTNGSVEGTITDPQGAAVPGAALTLFNSDTGLKLEATSDENGLFHFPVVPVGSYRLIAEHSGFAKYAANVTVDVGAAINVPVQLTIGTQASSVSVTSEAPVIEATRSSVES